MALLDWLLDYPGALDTLNCCRYQVLSPPWLLLLGILSVKKLLDSRDCQELSALCLIVASPLVIQSSSSEFSMRISLPYSLADGHCDSATQVMHGSTLQVEENMGDLGAYAA